MLKRFVVENYKNFKERTEINFGAVRSYSFNDYCTKDGILNKSILLGKNGSGKTNLGLALFDIVGTLTDNTILPEQADQGSFLNGESVNKFAVFEYEFQMGEKTIRYVYHKTDFFNIVYEMMEVDGELVFRRDGKSGEYSGLKEYGAGTLRIDLIDGRLSVLRYVYANTVQDVTSPIAFVMDFVRHMLYFKSDTVGNAFIGYGKAGEDIYGFIADNRLTMDLQRMLGEIAGVETDLSSINMPGVPGTLVQRIGDKQIPFDSVSSSGIRAFVRFYYWYRHLDDVRFLYMDGFDIHYHHEMSEKIVRMISEMEGVQTVFTTHNTSLLSNDLLRPDCYLILEDGMVRSFADSTDRELRQGHNLEKMYRNGVFDS